MKLEIGEVNFKFFPNQLDSNMTNIAKDIFVIQTEGIQKK